ncbi:hypothetical protein Tco_1262563 [Tanacetum coccineum]
MNPNMPIKAIQEQMQKKFHVAVSRDKAFRAKAKAAVSLRGDVKIQYALLRDYVMELKRCNPDTTVKIDVYGEEDPESPTRLFRRIYVCLGALKKGFREGGRELLGLDVESENHILGLGFLKCLVMILIYTAISNFNILQVRQKGLLPALEKLFPHAEHRAYFSGRAHCDLLINNICEVFNRQLFELKDSILSLLPLETCEGNIIEGGIVVVQKIQLKNVDGPLTPACYLKNNMFLHLNMDLFLSGSGWISGINQRTNKRSSVIEKKTTLQGGTSMLRSWKNNFRRLEQVMCWKKQASQASKGGTSNAGTQASTGSPPEKNKETVSSKDCLCKTRLFIAPSSSIWFSWSDRLGWIVPADIAKRFKEGDITRELVKWYGYVDILEYFEDDAYWDSYSPTTDEKEVPLGKYIPIGKHAAARPIIKSEAFQTGVVLGVANQKTWAAIVEKLRKRPSKH